MSYHILCIDDDPKFLFSIKATLKNKYQVTTVETFKDAKEVLRSGIVDLVFLDLELGEINGLKALKTITDKFPGVEVFMLSGHKNPKEIVESIRLGAADYISKDSYSDEIFAYIEKALHNRSIKDRYAALIQNYNPGLAEKDFVGGAESFQSTLDQARRLRGYNTCLLYTSDAADES